MGGKKEKTTIVQPPAPPQIERSPEQIQQEISAAMRGAAGTSRELYPEQHGLYQTFMQQLQGQLQQPQFMSAEEQAAQEAIRGREQDRLRQGILTAANIGGGLYGGRTERRVDRGMGELSQAYAQQDIANRMARQQMLYGAVSPFAGQYPQMSQQGVVSPESLQNVYAQRMMAQQPQVFFQPAQPSPLWEAGGAFAGQVAGGAKPWWMGGGGG